MAREALAGQGLAAARAPVRWRRSASRTRPESTRERAGSFPSALSAIPVVGPAGTPGCRSSPRRAARGRRRSAAAPAGAAASVARSRHISGNSRTRPPAPSSRRSAAPAGPGAARLQQRLVQRHVEGGITRPERSKNQSFEGDRTSDIRHRSRQPPAPPRARSGD